jgi:hypothetical protein
VNDEVGLKLTCKYHGGRLFFAWLSGDGVFDFVPAKGRVFSVDSFNGQLIALGREDGSTYIDGQGSSGRFSTWCTRPGCRQRADVSGRWLEERLRLVAEAYAAGIGPRVVTLPLSEVGTSRRRTNLAKDA